MDFDKNSALGVNEGIAQPKSTNYDSISKYKNKVKELKDVDFYVNGIINYDKSILSQAITLVESSLEEHQKVANEIIRKCQKCVQKSTMRIGITGAPGVGKSTFIEEIGRQIIREGRRLAVLAIDPTSVKSRGSILGDKTRMGKISGMDEVFIRPSPSAGNLGGVARKTRETIVLCEAAGYNTIFIETVGVGQSEIAVHSMVDYFLLLLLAGAGDELQGIKRGIMEMADGIAITKADGDNKQSAELAKHQYENALHLFPEKESKWQPNLYTISSKTQNGIKSLWDDVNKYINFTSNTGYFATNRINQTLFWFYETINDALKTDFYSNKIVIEEIEKIKINLKKGKENPFESARKLIENFNKFKEK